ncbi:MAG: sigma-70 family RNA polymerase sigma factor [Halopseudomonas aestusnigri]
MEKAATDVMEFIPGLRRYARALTGNSTEADDLVQESLCRALTRQKKGGKINNLKGYLFAILHNTHVDRAKESSRWNYNVPDEVLENLLYSPAPQPHVLALKDLGEALMQLPEEQRKTMLLVGYEGLSYKDTAVALDVPIGTVMSRLFRGRESLRQLTGRVTGATRLRKVH